MDFTGEAILNMMYVRQSWPNEIWGQMPGGLGTSVECEMVQDQATEWCLADWDELPNPLLCVVPAVWYRGMPTA